MGKQGNSKAKEKKMERKLMEMKMNAGWAGVNKANAQENPLAVLPSFSKFKKDGLNLTLETKRTSVKVRILCRDMPYQKCAVA